MFALFSGLLGTAFSVLIRMELSGPGVQYIADNQLVRRTSVTAYTDCFLYTIPASKLGFKNLCNFSTVNFILFQRVIPYMYLIIFTLIGNYGSSIPSYCCNINKRSSIAYSSRITYLKSPFDIHYSLSIGRVYYSVSRDEVPGELVSSANSCSTDKNISCIVSYDKLELVEVREQIFVENKNKSGVYR